MYNVENMLPSALAAEMQQVIDREILKKILVSAGRGGVWTSMSVTQARKVLRKVHGIKGTNDVLDGLLVELRTQENEDLDKQLNLV